MRTLSNAVTQDKVHHAYLFVGSRGTGKTSMAKILAACLNCESGPTIEPCGRCDSCVAIASATSLDVIEMDAASNNSVDDIRELRESVQFAPVSGRSKVYILDEAHMLSSQAWNAFLKTLEEPPPDTIFVLATTEANKVLPTVVDRCHRFDFGRPTVKQLAAVVERVARSEEIDIAPDAIALLARHATGSFRDALGTLEQLVTYTGTSIATEDVLAVLGVADAELTFGALDAVAAGDARGAWLACARLAETGRDVSQFLRDLEAHARDLLVVQTLGDVPPELSLTPEHDARLAEQAARIPGQSVVRLLDLLADAMRSVKDGADARTRLETALVKAAAPQVDPAARALTARLERLEAGLAAGAAVTAAPPAPPPVLAAAPPPPPAPAPPRAVEPEPEPEPEPRGCRGARGHHDRRRAAPRAHARLRGRGLARGPGRRARRERPAGRVPGRRPLRRAARRRARPGLRRERRVQPPPGRRRRQPRHDRRRAALRGGRAPARRARAARPRARGGRRAPAAAHRRGDRRPPASRLRRRGDPPRRGASVRPTTPEGA